MKKDSTQHPKYVNALDITRLQQQDLASKRTGLAPLTDEFVQEHLPMIEAIASSISGKGSLPTGIEFEDLVSWGIEGLIKAHKNYKSDKGTIFKTYAYYRIRGEMYDRVRSEWQYRNPTDYSDHRRKIQERIADVVEEALAATGDVSQKTIEERMNHLIYDSAIVCLMSLEAVEDVEGVPDQSFALAEDAHSDLWDEVGKLDDEERQIVDLFYVQGLKQKEIADKLNQSRSRVCRVHMKVLDKLKRRLSKKRTN
ncbi:sigma-70 family RNA polymerase sigma factor [bacterium]|nr:sigma-70 family RNA polymerase sigma factor [bacterium]